MINRRLAHSLNVVNIMQAGLKLGKQDTVNKCECIIVDTDGYALTATLFFENLPPLYIILAFLADSKTSWVVPEKAEDLQAGDTRY